MAIKETIEYAAAMALVLVLVMLVTEILHYLLPTPWYIGLSLLILASIGPITWTIEGWIFGETTFEDEP